MYRRHQIQALLVFAVFLITLYYSYTVFQTADYKPRSGDKVVSPGTKTTYVRLTPGAKRADNGPIMEDKLTEVGLVKSAHEQLASWITTANEKLASWIKTADKKLASGIKIAYDKTTSNSSINSLLPRNYATARYARHRCESNQTYIDFGSSLSPEQTTRVNQCVQTYEAQRKQGLEREITGRSIRYTTHSHLSQDSFVIEAGGHMGVDVQELNSRYHPGTYIVLEPVPKFYNALVDRFKTSTNVQVHRYGIDASDGEFYVNDKHNDGASIFKKGQETGQVSRIMNATKFFENVSVRSRDVDLLTMNCEGCEYAVIDLLLSTNYIRHFKSIQFQPHKIDGICYPVKRFCWYQELLTKTHKLTFQFKFVWENWIMI